ncbi:ABC transporter permease [Brevibacillus borstelensis]|uniref:ABC transporter permease n=1 Tax=Brevibacillus borstelensis TaxID=45462 RepID=UPI003CE4810D
MDSKKRNRHNLFLAPRWIKIFRDLWLYKGRSLLVVFTIAVGVTGVGATGHAPNVLENAMSNSLLSVKPAQITIQTEPFLDDGILDDLLEHPDIAYAEAFQYYRMRINAEIDDQGQPIAGSWKTFELFARPDYVNMQMDVMTPEEIAGEWPLADGELFLEHLTAEYLGVQIHDAVWIETPDSELHHFYVDGTVRNPARESATLSKVGAGFVSEDTLESLGLPAGYNMISIRLISDAPDLKQLESIAADAREILEEHSIRVESTLIPEPGKHWASDIVLSMSSILRTLGALVLLASAFLIVNIMLSILSSQYRQIGVMQVLGANADSLVRLYLVQAAIFGLLALIIGLPAGYFGAKAVTGQSNYYLNISSDSYTFSSMIFGLQIAVGLGLPLLAAYFPVLHGTRISIREAISGLSSGTIRRNFLDKILENIRQLPRPFLLSLRNTFRQKGRLLLTLFTLGLGGGVVISVFSVQASLKNSLDQSLLYAKYDVRVTTVEPQEEAVLSEIALQVPDAVQAESWGLVRAYRVYEDGSESVELTIHALPFDSDFIQPQMIEGEWLGPDEDDTIVVDSFLLRYFPDLQVGDPIVLKTGENERTWRIKGFSRKTIGEPVSYITKEGMLRAIDDDSLASLVHLRINEHDAVSQLAAESELKKRLKDEGIEVASSDNTSEMRSIQEARINIVLVFLSLMAILLSIVSVLSLIGTMSLNVMERTREYGILRCIGASDGAVAGIVIAEGALLGAIGWGIGCLMALPVSYWLAQSVGLSLYQAPLDFVYSWTGVAFWFVTAIVSAALASVAPAWNAIHLPTQEVLSYE